ncbi:hypothetical protein A4X13_0g6118 [Tilletia indica]|uniref:XPG N-terminal domain-containing protein n=1 Tax=Tilletia indica TaxID=43049 RepID=A0A177TFX7_9BASI|nr:hypothetical protein A4X13_0g6118 [Tilletia indica]
MHATRLLYGVRRIFPFLREIAPATLRPIPASHLSGKTIAIDATLISTRFHFADDPHPARHLFGFCRLIRSLRALDARAIMVFDHPIGGTRARNPAKLHEAERRRTQRALVTRRALLERKRFERIKSLSELTTKYERLSRQESALLHDQLRTAYNNPALMPRRRTDAEADEVSDDSLDAELLCADDRLDEGNEAERSANVDSEQTTEEGWDEPVGTSIWDELIQDEQIASAALSTSLEILENDLPAQPALIADGQEVPAHIAELVSQFHYARLRFEHLHHALAEEQSATKDGESFAESRNQAALTAAEARIHQTMLDRGAPGASLGQLHQQAALPDEEAVLADEVDDAEDGEEATEEVEEGTTEAATAVPQILQSDLLPGLSEPGTAETSSESTSAGIAESEPSTLESFELDSMHSKSTALSKSYHRASAPLKPQTIIDCAYLCALMGVPVLFTSRGTGAYTSNPEDDTLPLTIPGAAWAGHARLRSRAHEAEALAASLVHAGFAEVVASEDSDVLMYDVPMLRGLSGGNVAGNGSGLGGPKGLVWVDAKEVRRTLFDVREGGRSEDVAVEDGEDVEGEEEKRMTKGILEDEEQAVEDEVNADDAAFLTAEPSITLSASSEDMKSGIEELDALIANDDGSKESSALAQHSPLNMDDETAGPGKKAKVLSPDEENRRLFIEFALLLGTDFNRSIPGVGPKGAHSLMKEHRSISAILRLKRAQKAAATAKSKSPRKAVVVPPNRGPKFKFSPPPPLNRREYLIELARARNVFTSPPTLYGNLARLRRWAAGGEYFDWSGSVSEEEEVAEDDVGGRKLAESQRKRSVRKEDQWRRGEVTGLFRRYGVRRLPDEDFREVVSRTKKGLGFGTTIDSFMNDLADEQQKRTSVEATNESAASDTAHMEALDGADVDRATGKSTDSASISTSSFTSRAADPFGSDVFGERDVPSGSQAEALLAKTARSRSSAGQRASRRTATGKKASKEKWPQGAAEEPAVEGNVTPALS